MSCMKSPSPHPCTSPLSFSSQCARLHSVSLVNQLPASSQILAGPPRLFLCPPPHHGSVPLPLLRITNTAQHLCFGPRCVPTLVSGVVTFLTFMQCSVLICTYLHKYRMCYFYMMSFVKCNIFVDVLIFLLTYCSVLQEIANL